MESRLEHVRSQLEGGGAAPALAAATSGGPDRESGAFNERLKQEEKNATLSHSLFSTFGLDHFPRYLSRWPLEEVEALESQL